MPLSKTVMIDLADLSLLLSFYWSCVNSTVGELGVISYEETVSAINKQSRIEVTPEQLEHLVFHFKQAIFDGLPSSFIDRSPKSYNGLMKRLMNDVPELFEKKASGEVVFKERGDNVA